MHKDASRSDKLVRELGNAPRALAIDKLKKLEIVPEVPEKEGTVIGIVTEDRGIVCVDEKAIKQLAWPAIQRHVDQHIPAYPNFKIVAINFNLFRNGLLQLVFSLASEQDPMLQKVYVWPQVHDNLIIMKPRVTAYSCSVTSCPNRCIITGCTYRTDIWCQCSTSSEHGENKGCTLSR